MGLRMQPRNEKFFTLFSKAGSNVVESAAILMEFVAAPHELWAELAKRMHDTEHAGDHTTKPRSASGQRPTTTRRLVPKLTNTEIPRQAAVPEQMTRDTQVGPLPINPARSPLLPLESWPVRYPCGGWAGW